MALGITKNDEICVIIYVSIYEKIQFFQYEIPFQNRNKSPELELEVNCSVLLFVIIAL